MRILVTGGSGFIGTNLISELLQEGHDVCIYDTEASKGYPDLCTVADVRDAETLTQALRGIDVVYHLAAVHRDDVRPVSLYYDVNLNGAESLVSAAEENNVKKIIFTSSVAIYGLNSNKPDEMSHPKPFNHYSRSKLLSEEIFRKWFSRDSSRSMIILRPVVIFGERNRGNVYELLKQIASGKFLMVGNGKNAKSMGYVLNLSRFLTKLLERRSGMYTYNYADKPDMSMDELVKTAKQAMGMDSKPIWKIPYSLGLVGGYFFDILAKVTCRTYPVSSIRVKKFAADTTVAADRLKETGFVPPYSLEEGLKRMIESEFGNRNDEKA